jgi:hypothetical protein
LQHNLRCVRIAHNYVSRGDVASATVSAPQAQERAKIYFEQLAAKESSITKPKIQFFELSIFDSGCGFAPTITYGNDAENVADSVAVQRCFLRHKTAKNSPTAGLGLNRILKEVHELSGFLRIRTNTVEAFYAPVSGLDPNSNPALYVHGGLAHVEGTALTVAIPVSF